MTSLASIKEHMIQCFDGLWICRAIKKSQLRTRSSCTEINARWNQRLSATIRVEATDSPETFSVQQRRENRKYCIYDLSVNAVLTIVQRYVVDTIVSRRITKVGKGGGVWSVNVLKPISSAFACIPYQGHSGCLTARRY